MKKIAIYLLLILGSFLSFGFANNMDNYQNSIKVKKLVKLETPIVNYLTERFQADLSGLNNEQLQKIFEAKINGDGGIIYQLQDKFLEMRYSSEKQSYDSYLAQLKDLLAPYKNIEAEIKNIKSGNSSEYILSGDEISTVKANILDIQKALANTFEKDMMDNILSYSGLQETGNMNFSVNTVYGNISFKLSDYSTKMDFENGLQDMNTKMNIDFDLNIPGEGIQSGSVYLDLSMVMQDQDMYITINDYDIKLDNADSDVAQSLKMLALIKGKTLHISAPAKTEGFQSYSNLKGNNSLIVLKKVLNAMKSQSFFTPFKKVEGGYKIMIDIDALNSVFGEVNPYFERLNDFMIIRENLDYSDEKGIFMIINDLTSNGEISIYKEGDGIVAKCQVIGTGFASGNVFDMLWKSQYLKMNLNSKEMKFNIDWENGKLNMNLNFMGMSFGITGDYSKRNADLKINYNDSEIGHLKSVYDGNYGTYDMYLNLDAFKDFAEFFKSFELKFVGDAGIQTGEVNISIPTDYLEMDNLLQLQGALSE